ncbi:hypothetical protein DBR11_16605 [Pedobacter sp. HMWF019]|uniref:FecR family protein n=1 Tax=Pedobacter sp. HMWF019 TaxID=2056856 RepID=UPI000D34D6F7|nr:FecR domain-containing protein [Pedobacter sp. HMWF019]PTS97730.1 hypothetical protein DBR11_16605 [Pedobacter sp. HMWF019]
MEINRDIIQRYHLGLCNPNEIAIVEAWLESDQVSMTFLEGEELQLLEDAGWEQLGEHLELKQNHIVEIPNKKLKIRRFRLGWQIAASIGFLLGISAIYFVYYSSLQKNKAGQVSAKLIYREIHTKKGEKLQVSLPDGTQVWMNSESTLHFPKQFAKDQRSVSFRGEAYFRVTKNPKKPFIITSERARIQVLGTRFNLRDYANEKLSWVVVEEGKVRFSGIAATENLILTANQKGVYEPGAQSVLTSQLVYNTAKYMDWKDNKLVLDNLTLLEICPIIERWYGVKLLIVDEELGNRRYTGSFENPGIKQVVESISFALKSKCRQHNNTWTISK